MQMHPRCTHLACRCLRSCARPHAAARPTTSPALTQQEQPPRRDTHSSHLKPSSASVSNPHLTPTPRLPSTPSSPAPISHRRFFHDYFVTHLPSSSLHPDQRSSAGPRHQLPRSASRPHTASGLAPAHVGDASPSPSRDTTVVRIPLRSAKHHFGAAVSRGQRAYNEDAFQAGVVEIPAFAKRAPMSLTKGPRASQAAVRNVPSDPLAEYKRRQEMKEGGEREEEGEGDSTGAANRAGDPQVFYFGVFDGHGGAECSEFLRDGLHSYVERAAAEFGLRSSLRREDDPPEVIRSVKPGKGGDPAETKTEGRPDAAAKPEDPKHPTHGTDDNSGPPKSSHAAEQGVDQESAKRLEEELLKSWKMRVGGYFKRFQPELFYDATDQSKSGADISTILTYAFLRADLDFISAQARKPAKDSESDPVKADRAINADDSLSGESEIEIGGPHRFEGGSTCSVAMVSTPTPTPFWHPTTPATMIVAHVGDTRILLCRTSDGLAVPCTSNHHPSNPEEERRLRRFSGHIVTDSFGEERISGFANTRAFGDMRSKRVGVSAEPEVTRIEMAAAEYSFIVLMSDGITGTLNDQEVVDIVKEAKTPEEGARSVVSFATEVSLSGDNATCLVVRLGGWTRRGEGGGGSMHTKESRDLKREEAASPRSRRT